MTVKRFFRLLLGTDVVLLLALAGLAGLLFVDQQHALVESKDCQGKRDGSIQRQQDAPESDTRQRQRHLRLVGKVGTYLNTTYPRRRWERSSAVLFCSQGAAAIGL